MISLATRGRQAGLLVSLFTAVSLSASAATSADKALNRAISSYTKYISKAEKKNCDLEKGKFKGCQREVKALDRRYEKFSDDVKANPAITELNQRHQRLSQILATLERQAIVKKVARKYELSVVRMETQSCLKQSHYMGPEAVRCHKDLLKADAAKAKIPQNMLSEAIIADLAKRHEAMRGMPAYIQKVTRQNASALASAVTVHVEFNDRLKHLGYWQELEKGKNNTAGTLHQLEKMSSQLNEYLSFANDCKGKYASYISDKPAAVYQCQLAENAQSHINHYSAATYKVFLADETKKVNSVYTALKSEGYIRLNDYRLLVLNTNAYIQDVETRVHNSHQRVNQKTPDFKSFEKTVALLPDALETAVSNNSWDALDSVEVSSAMEKRASKIAELNDWELVEAGQKDRPWSVVKNDLDIPLRKKIPGWVMFKAPDESFCRIHSVDYSREFNGTGYEPISHIEVGSAVSPAPCS